MKRITLAVVASLALAVGACGVGPDQSREDAGDAPASAVDKTQPRVMAFNNHFPNVETKCGAPGQRVYVGSHDSSTGNNILVVPDTNCR